MYEMIRKDSLNQTIELISELNLDKNDFNKIFERFKVILESPEVNDIIKKISENQDLNKQDDLITLMKELSNKLSLKDLNVLLKKVIKNENLVDFLQDMFLEKLI